MGGEYSFLEGMTKAANPYLQGAMKEGWRRKSEDKATAEAIKRTQDSRKWQTGLELAKRGVGEFDNPQLQALRDSQKDINEQKIVQKKIDETRAAMADKIKNLQFMFDASKNIKTMAMSGEPDATVLANINQLMSIHRDMGYPMPDWTPTDRINYVEKIKSINNKYITAVREKTNTFSKDISSIPSSTMQPKMWVNQKAKNLLAEFAVVKVNITDTGTLATIALEENSIKKTAKDFGIEFDKKKDRQNKITDAKAKEGRALEDKKTMATFKAGLTPKPTGELTEASVLKTLNDQSWMSEKKLATMTKQYVKEKKKLKGSGLTEGQIRFEALNIVLEGVEKPIDYSKMSKEELNKRLLEALKQ